MTETVLKVSVSGGRTSGFMAWWIHNNQEQVAENLGVDLDNLDIVYTFANTGMEHNDTLRFVRDIELNFGIPIVWLEAVVHHGKRKGCTHRVVDFDSAFRNDQWMNPLHPFHNEITKYGVPNVAFKRCTSELKLNPMNSYMRELGFKGASYYTAVGIREDETRRVAKSATKDKIVYPLIDWEPMCKDEILDWWAQFEWDLTIPEWLGNCVTCYKKSFKKLGLVYRERPEFFEFNKFMEDNYKQVGPADEDRLFFRNNTDTRTLLRQFDALNDVDFSNYVNTDDSGGCSESCEVYETVEAID